MNGQYKAVIATTNVTTLNTKLLKEALEAIVKDQPSVPVRINFSGDRIGTASNFTLTDEKLSCEFNCNIAELDKLGVYLTPGFKVQNDNIVSIGGITEIKQIELTETSLTTLPADKRLTQIEKEY